MVRMFWMVSGTQWFTRATASRCSIWALSIRF